MCVPPHQPCPFDTNLRNALLALGSVPLVVFNVLNLLLGGTVLALKVRGDARPGRASGHPAMGAGAAR